MKNYYLLPNLNSEFIKKQKYFLLFETSKFDRDNFTSHIFFDPIDIIKINRFEDVILAFQKIEEYSKKHYLAGYFSYELGYCFENIKLQAEGNYPLIHLAVFNKAITFNHKTSRLSHHIPGLFTSRPENKTFKVQGLKLNIQEQEYIRKIKQLKKYIRAGDTYQVNFTGKYNFNFQGSAISFYQHLKAKQNVSYSAFCKLKFEYLLSLSPELFFRREGNIISSRPMKGTIKRGKDKHEDRLMFMKLRENAKNRAENLMIVDLVRNDLGRICKTGSVKTSELFTIEKYQSLLQMTSTVRGQLKPGITYWDIFKNIFPGGSVTGAPKIRTMQIIKGLESAPRNVYCGALGMIFPKSRAIFNLPIRTISIRGAQAEMGIGSGIVYDSQTKEEYKECLLKAKFLTDASPEFSLLETILWDNGYKYLADHLKRMRDSAEYFGFLYDRKEITLELKKIERNFKRGLKYKIRLLLDRRGEVRLEYSVIVNDNKKKLVVVSRQRINPDNVFLYHKTTNRQLYDSEYAYWHKKGFFDVIFLNTNQEVAEGAISNIVIRKNNNYYTPPVSAGLLPGIFRNRLIEQGSIRERRLFLEDLQQADKIFLCNSARGMTEVRLRN